MSLNGSLQAQTLLTIVQSVSYAQKGTLNKFLVDGRVCCSCWASGLHLWSVQMISRGRCSPAQNCFAVLQKTLFHVDGVPSLVQCTFISLKGLYEDGATEFVCHYRLVPENLVPVYLQVSPSL